MSTARRSHRRMAAARVDDFGSPDFGPESRPLVVDLEADSSTILCQPAFVLGEAHEADVSCGTFGVCSVVFVGRAFSHRVVDRNGIHSAPAGGCDLACTR